MFRHGRNGMLSFVHCYFLRDCSSNELGGTLPPQLSNLTQLQQLYVRINWRTASFSLKIFIFSDLYSLNSQSLCILIRSFCPLRRLNLNQLNGTIPPQLGDLTQLQAMYAEHSFDPLMTCLQFASIDSPVCNLIRSFIAV